ncbi:TPA: glycosyltransferase family 29 protein [Escherichia coli]|nr:hypothetical protein [Escherichia coli]HDP5147477.1 glycosyltransferase family 29 protein [Escherichia coli]
MNKLYRKTRKLVLNPVSFFKDSKPLSSIVIKKSDSNVKNIKQNKVSSNNKNTIIVFINDSFKNNDKLKNHLIKTIQPICTLKISNFRLKKNEILLSSGAEFLLVKINPVCENNTIVKGFLLIEAITSTTTSDLSPFTNIIHKINVAHMKSINDFNMLYNYYSNRKEATEQSLIKYALSAGIYSEDIINRAIIIMEENSNTLSQSDVILFFKKLYRVLGTDGKLEKIANNIFNQCKKNIYPIHFMMSIAAFFTESGAYDKAIELALKAKAKDKNAWLNNRYLGLTYLLVESNLLKEEWAVKDSNLFLSLRKNEWDFENYVLNFKDNIALVGNSPIELGKRKGTKIDSFPKVARFNSAITEYPYYLDYGRKTNILVINPRYYETQRNMKHGLDYIIISDGNLYSSKNISYKLHDLMQFTSKICFIPRRVDIRLTHEISSSPSSGLKFIHWIYSISGHVLNSNIFGFSMNDQSHGVATSYSSGKRVGLNTIHDWNKEKQYFESIIMENNTKEYV